VDFFWRRLSGGTVAARSASELGEQVAELGSVTPWNADWAASPADDLADLKAFFAAAADAGGAMVKFESA
jgi:hypothetical protein